MPGVDLFRAPTPEAIKAGLRAAKMQAHRRLADSYERAIDYAEGRQLEDTRRLLLDRYRSAQEGPRGEKIEPMTLPLTQRYVAEAADAFNDLPKLEVVDESGKKLEEPTKVVADALEACAFDEHMHALERIVVLIRSCGQWWQARRGQLRPRIVVPHHAHPITPGDTRFFDPSDVDDYLGFVVELCNDGEDQTRAEAQQFAFLTPAEHVYFEAQSWDEWDGDGDAFPNPFMWPQTVDTDDQRGTEGEHPLQMLTFWHDRMPVDELVIDTDADIVDVNRELNVQWSVLLDTMRTQGMAQMFMNTMNGQVPARVPVGSRFAIPLQVGESIGFATTGNDYTGMVAVLKNVVQLIAILKRQSGSDFSVDGNGPESGFAKIVASLPKIEARKERVRRLKRTLEQRAWPRIAAILKYLGKLQGDVAKMRLRATFGDVKQIESVDEETKRQEHRFKFNLSSPVHALAEQRGITLEEARKVIAEHAKENEQHRAEAMEQAQANAAGAARRSPFGDLAGRPRRPPPTKSE